MNKVIITGRLTADPEVKQTQSGLAVVDFTIAVDRGYNKAERRTDFVAVQAWRATAEFVGKYFRKGKPILVTGQLINDQWTDKEGKKRDQWKVRTDEVEFYGDKQSQTEEEGNEKLNPQFTDVPAEEYDNLPF